MTYQKNNPPHTITKKSTQTGFGNGGEVRGRLIFCNGAQADGFTLIELIIVMVIMAVIAAVSIPRLGSIFKTKSFRQMVNKAIVFLKDARIDALTTGKKTSVAVDLEDGKLMRLTDGVVVRNLQMPDEVEMWLEQEEGLGPTRKIGASALFFGGDENVEFTFYPNGTASGPRLLLKDTNRGRSAIIYLEPPAGLIRYKIGMFNEQG